jgi:hypothetical protein
MDFDKVSFRTTQDEREYLEELAGRYGASSVTEFIHMFLADCMKTNVGSVYSRSTDRSGSDRFDRPMDRRNAEMITAKHRQNDTVNPAILHMILGSQQQQIVHLQQTNRQQQDLIHQQKQQIDYLEQQLCNVNYMPPYWMMPISKSQSYDPVATMMIETEKIARTKRAIDSLDG